MSSSRERCVSRVIVVLARQMAQRRPDPLVIAQKSARSALRCHGTAFFTLRHVVTAAPPVSSIACLSINDHAFWRRELLTGEIPKDGARWRRNACVHAATLRADLFRRRLRACLSNTTGAISAVASGVRTRTTPTPRQGTFCDRLPIAAAALERASASSWKETRFQYRARLRCQPVFAPSARRPGDTWPRRVRTPSWTITAATDAGTSGPSTNRGPDATSVST
jgi:hypothetical protein